MTSMSAAGKLPSPSGVPQARVIYIVEEPIVQLRGTGPLRERQAIGRGAFGFTAASLVVFGSWAFAGRWMYSSLGELGAYAVWALMFVVLAGVALSRLIPGRVSSARSCAVFAVAFLLYAAGWTVAWFLWRDKFGEWMGSLAGTLLMTGALLAGFSSWRVAVSVAVTLFVAHSLGYFAGAVLYETIGGRPGMLLWGLAYGLGFGAGIGRALFLCQRGTEGVPAAPKSDEKRMNGPSGT